MASAVPVDFTQESIPKQVGGASREYRKVDVGKKPKDAPATSALSRLIDNNKGRFDSASPSPGASSPLQSNSPSSASTGEDSCSGRIDSAGEIGNISSPRCSSSVHSSISSSKIPAGSVEARFIVNLPRTPSSQSQSSQSHSFLARSMSKISLNRTSSVRNGASIPVAQSTGHNRMASSASSSVTSMKSFLRRNKTPDDSPAGSIESSSVFEVKSPRQSLSKSYGKIGKVLGEGAGGHVKIVKNSQGQMFAVKEFRTKHTSESQREYQKKCGAEYTLGLSLRHPNIIATVDTIHEDDKVYHIMEYCDYDLFAIVMSGKMSRKEVYCDFAQIMAGVRYLHESGIAHRDLKLDNCVVNSEGIVKIIDFGSAVVYKYACNDRRHDTQGVVGSDPYLAPEASGNDRYDPCAADIWSTCVMLCCMLMRKFPWRAPKMSDPSYKTFVTEERLGNGPQKLLANLPEETHELITHMFDLDPVARWDVEQCWASTFLNTVQCCSLDPPGTPHDHTHTTVPFDEAHIAMLERKNRKAKKGEKMW